MALLIPSTTSSHRSRPRVSVVTPTYNHARFIRDTLESVLCQEGHFDLEYWVIDGGSTDGTLEILKSYTGRLQWLSEPDRGQVEAINKGLRFCTGDIVGWLNSDDLLLPGALQRVVEVFATRPEVEWVHGRCRIINEHGQIVRRWVELYKHARAMRHSLESLLTENYVSQMTVFWRRSLLGEVGYLDPEFPLAFDYDLWLRFARRSAPAYIEQPQACFRWYESSKSGANFRAQFIEDAMVAARHGAGRRDLQRRKRLRNRLIVGMYTAMAVGRELGRSIRLKGV